MTGYNNMNNDGLLSLSYVVDQASPTDHEILCQKFTWPNQNLTLYALRQPKSYRSH